MYSIHEDGSKFRVDYRLDNGTVMRVAFLNTYEKAAIKIAQLTNA